MDNEPARFRWCDASEYARLDCRPGLVVLIRPAAPERQARWASVMRWYGCRPSDPADGPPSWVSGSVAGLVVALDERARAAARVLAEQTGRQLHVLPAGDADPARRLADLASGPLVLIGLPGHFDAALLAALNRIEQLEWSVLTGRDEPGLAFVVAKVLAHRWRQERAGEARDRPIAVVDAIDGSVRHLIGPTDAGELRALGGSDVTGLVDGDWHAVVLRTHGEGSHANLGSAVLCAATDGPERLRDGAPAGGCAIGVCKRTPGTARVVPFAELRTAHLAYYSCNGFSVTAQLYPSDLSTVLALADGYPVAVLANDRSGRIDQLGLDAAAARLARDHGLQGLWRTENDRQAKIDGVRPWIRLGDSDPPRYTTAPDQTSLVTVAVPDKAATSGPVWSAEPAELVRGLVLDNDAAHVLLTRPASGPGLAAVRLVNCAASWASRHRSLLHLRRRSAQNAELRYAIPRLFQAHLDRDPAAAGTFDALCEIQDQVTRAGVQAFDALQEVRRSGVSAPRAELQYELHTLLVTEWDRRFAALAHACLLKGSAERLLIGGRIGALPDQAETCGRCGQPVPLRRFIDPLGAMGDVVQASCTVCGPLGSWLDGGPRLTLSIPRWANKGSAVGIDIAVAEPDGAPAPSGILILLFKDKGTGREFWEYFGPVTPLRVPIPDDATSDLHTLRGIWVGSLSFAYARVRCAIVPQHRYLEDR